MDQKKLRSGKEQEMIVAVTITGEDRPGIIAAVTKEIFKLQGNLEDASMTILEGEFAMILLARLKTNALVTHLRERLIVVESHYRLSISVRPIARRLRRGEKHVRGTESWVVSVLGKDRAGIVFRVCQVLAAARLNITDLNSKLIGHGRRASYTLILEVDVPKKPELIGHLRKRFQALGKRLRVQITFDRLETACL